MKTDVITLSDLIAYENVQINHTTVLKEFVEKFDNGEFPELIKVGAEFTISSTESIIDRYMLTVAKLGENKYCFESALPARLMTTGFISSTYPWAHLLGKVFKSPDALREAFKKALLK